MLLKIMIKKIFKIRGMHCTSCALDIDWELEETKGVKEVKTNYAKQLTEVEFNEQEIDEEQIVKIVNRLGYSVTSD